VNIFNTSAKQVLIVEDEFIVAMDLANNLRDLGYAIAAQVETAEQAIEAADRLRPDLVLMDIQLKGEVDGVVAAATIRERWSIPVVFVTANTNANTLSRAKASGPFGFISKPFRPRELDATIGIALNQHKLSRELFAERGWFTSMMASLSDGVIAADADGFVRYMNPAAEALLHWSSSDALGLPIERVYPLSTLDNQPVKECQLRKAMATREPVPKGRFLVHIHGDHQKPVEDSAAPIIEAGHLLGAVTIFLEISDQLAKEGRDVRQREQLQEQVDLSNIALGNSRQDLQALSHHLMIAQEDERSRIARELHDDLGQRSTLLGMKIRALESVVPEYLKPRVASAQRELVGLSQGLREVSHRLHPSVIADLGLGPALDSLIADFREQGVEADLETEEVSQVSVEVATALYRIAQEALQNVKKHAPGVAVHIRFWQEATNLQLSIRDEGPGFTLADVRQKGGLGLLSMQERARLIGGVLLLSTAPGEGSTVTVRVAFG
jgi:PAS domain S-box-containing protein